MARYRKKPVVIEAIQYFTTDGIENVKEFVGDSLREDYDGEFVILTLEGAFTIRSGDFIIKGVAGEFYSCRADIFLATYEQVQASMWPSKILKDYIGFNALMVTPGSLNPGFVCWLMGYPTAWENCADMVTLSSRKSRQNLLKPI